MFRDGGQAQTKAWICRTFDSCNFAPYLQMHVVDMAASASATTVAAIGIIQNARDINLRSGFKSVRQTFCPELIRKCRCCKTGTLLTIDVFGKRGPPPHYFIGLQNAPVP